MNIYDVAKEAGVSIATVSRVINNKGNVSDKTRAKIEAVMLKSGYQPSAVARGLANGFGAPADRSGLSCHHMQHWRRCLRLAPLSDDHA